MANKERGGRDLPPVMVGGVLVLVALVVVVLAWKFVFAGPPANPLGNLTKQQILDRYKKISKERAEKGEKSTDFKSTPESGGAGGKTGGGG